MNPKDFVFEEIYRGAIKSGAKERIAKDCAIAGIDAWKKISLKAWLS